MLTNSFPADWEKICLKFVRGPTGAPTGAPAEIIGVPTGAPIGVLTGAPIGRPTGLLWDVVTFRAVKYRVECIRI